ncbi:hypothetical protein pb186bvf_014810 [Paramecium bursaria]
MSQQELVNKLTQRIQILVNEVESLTAVIDSSVIEQQDAVKNYQNLQKSHQELQMQLQEAQMKLNSAFKNNLKDHLEYIQSGKQQIGDLLAAPRQDPDHPLYQLCQQRTNEAQELRSRVSQLEQINYQLHAENVQLKTFIANDKMFRQLEQLNGNYQPQYQDNLDYKHLSHYVQSREPLLPKENYRF